MELKLDFQKSLYRIVLAIGGLMTLCATAASFYLYYFRYQEDIGMFYNDIWLTVYYAVSAAAIVAAIVMSFLPCFSMASTKLPTSGGAGMLFNSFCGFFVVAYTVLEILNIKNNGGQIPVWLYVMTFCAVVGSLYFHYQTVSANPNRVTLSIFGMFMVIFVIINIYAVHYTAQDILLNSPTRIGSLVAMTSVMMFLVNEIRYHLNIASPKVYFSFSILAVVFTLSDSIPRIVLSVMEKNGFSTGSGTLLLCFELFCGLYAVVRLLGYLKRGMFVLPVEEVNGEVKFNQYETYNLLDNEQSITSEQNEQDESYDSHSAENDCEAQGDDDCTVAEENTFDAADSELTEESAEGEVIADDGLAQEQEELFEGEKENDEPADGENEDYSNHIPVYDADDIDELSSMMSFSDNPEEDNDLPDDSGFEGGNEGEFEIEGFAIVEQSTIEESDDDDDDDGDAPRFIFDIDEDEFDDMIADEGQIIDYEELKSASAENIMLESTNNSQTVSEPEDDEDSLIDLDIMEILSASAEEEKPDSAEDKDQEKKKEKKSLVQKFKFVKKM